jgi:hypothetical protein
MAAEAEELHIRPLGRNYKTYLTQIGLRMEGLIAPIETDCHGRLKLTAVDGAQVGASAQINHRGPRQV